MADSSKRFYTIQELEERLSKNFKRKEFTCYCGCGLANISMSLVNDVLQLIRDEFGPIRITKGGGCRCESAARRLYRKQGKKYNPRSQHLLGKAADIKVERVNLSLDMWPYLEQVSPKEAAKFAAELMYRNTKTVLIKHFDSLGSIGSTIKEKGIDAYGGIIVYGESFTHLDVRDRPYRWGLK